MQKTFFIMNKISNLYYGVVAALFALTAITSFGVDSNKDFLQCDKLLEIAI